MIMSGTDFNPIYILRACFDSALPFRPDQGTLQITFCLVNSLSITPLNLCGRESLYDIRRDCGHPLVSEREFEHDARRICQPGRSVKCLLAGTKGSA